MKKLATIIERKRNIVGLLLLGGLIFTTYTIQEKTTQIKQLANFENGLQTCFTRVNQTYTAHLLSDTASAYLTQNFQNLTEECFAEGILSAEGSFQKELLNATKQLSNLASNVHWFHEDILAPKTNGIGRNVEGRFEKIETKKDQLLESTSLYKNEITTSLNKLKNIFYSSSVFLIMIMLGEFMNQARRRLLNNARERDALSELLNKGGVASVKVGDIIKTALEQNELTNCAKLFSNFHASADIGKNKNKITLDSLVTPIGTSLDTIWEDDTKTLAAEGTNISKLENVNLEKINSHLVDLLAEKLFSQGVQIDMNIPENLVIKAREEDLEQGLYHLFIYAINSTGVLTSSSDEKNISIFTHTLGDVVAFDLIYSGNGFEESFLRQRVGLDKEKNLLDLDLEISQSLFLEIGAKMQLDNKLDQNGKVIGGRVKIIFKKAAESEEKHLASLKVGTKKEILASFR